MKSHLSRCVHRLSERALSGEFSASLCDVRLKIDSIPNLDKLSKVKAYAEATKIIASHAPLRIISGELIVGAATLKSGPMHRMQIFTSEDEAAFVGVSHLTPGFYRALTIGYQGIRTQIAARLNKGDLDGKGVDFLEALLIVLEAASIWHQRHIDLLDALIDRSADKIRERYIKIRKNLHPVPEKPPASFHQAVQSLWFMFTFQRLCGNWPAIGRLDEILGPFLQKDLAQGKITLDEAREILAHFWVKGAEWAGAETAFKGSGDAQHYQNIVLAGVDARGEEVANEVTYLVLDVVEELHISDFPVAVRLSRSTPERLLKRVAEVQREGGGIIAVYNEDLVIDSLVNFGYPLEEARAFTNDGCWEILIPGKTAFSYRGCDALCLLQEVAGVLDTGDIPNFTDYATLYTAFYKRLKKHFLEEFHPMADSAFLDGPPAPLISLLIEDCIEKARDYSDRGAKYTVFAPHLGGIPDAGNSLYVIKKLVFEDQRFGYREFIRCLRDNWENHEYLQQYILNKFSLYGNQNTEVDEIVKRILDDFIDINKEIPYRNGVLRPVGVSNFASNATLKYRRKATATGYRDGYYIGATNFSPAVGTEKNGPTAVLQSHCSMDLGRITNGTAIELKIHPSSVSGEKGINSLIGLLKGFIRLNGLYMQIDVVDNRILLDAQEHPERYPNLVVRVAGWSARFNSLSKDYQDMIISRTTHDGA